MITKFKFDWFVPTQLDDKSATMRLDGIGRVFRARVTTILSIETPLDVKVERDFQKIGPPYYRCFWPRNPPEAASAPAESPIISYC